MRTLLMIALGVGLVGCVGDVAGMDPDPIHDPSTTNNPSGSDLTVPKKKFDDNVYPVLNMKCGNASCHAQAGTAGSITKFVATNASDGHKVATEYTALVGNFTSGAAPVLTMIKGGHKGVTYTSAEEAKIVEWLDAEVAARNGQPTTPTQPGGETLSQATERVISAFAGCMQFTDFQTANMANAWGGLTATNNQQCENCHATGGEGFEASRNAQFMYDVISQKKYYFLQYFTVDLTSGAMAAKVVMNQASFIGVANGQDPHREHPRFNATQNQGMTALTSFYNATMTRVGTAGLCMPKPLQNQ